MECGSMVCSRKHFNVSNQENHIIHYSEFLRIISCLLDEQRAICQSCGQWCNLSKIIFNFKKMNFKILETPNLYVKLIEFNKNL